MSNKKIYLILLVLIVFLVSLSIASAADTNTTNNDNTKILSKTTTTDGLTKSGNTGNTHTLNNSKEIVKEEKNKKTDKENKKIVNKTGIGTSKEAPGDGMVSISSSDTDLVSGLYAVYPNNVTIYSSDDTAWGDVDLYVDDVLVETLSDVNWNNLCVPIPDIKLVNRLPVLPEYFNQTGNYTWKLVFKDNQGYTADTNISGTLEMMDHVEITLTDNPVVINYRDYVVFNFTSKPDNLVGAILINTDLRMVEGVLIEQPHNMSAFMFNLRPGDYEVFANYNTQMVTDSFYEDLGLNPSYKFNNYPRCNDSNRIKVTVLKVPVMLKSFDTSYDEENNLYFTLDLTDDFGFLDEYNSGVFNIYYEDTLIKTLDLYDFNDEETSEPTMINFTLDKQYNNKSLKFEYTDKLRFMDDLVFERLIDLEHKNVTLTTSNETFTANVGDIVEIPYMFNDTSINDGRISISYGGSEDNITQVNSSTGSICFNTSDYLPGEYDLVLRYYDSSVYEEISIPLTLELYQPTSIIADKSELNVTLGERNNYPIVFETALDSYGDVIWGSVDVYVDDEIIDTVIVDDESGNTASIILDDYVLEDVTPGTHTLMAVFTTDDQYIRSSQTNVVLNVGGDVLLELPENPVAMIGENFVMPVNITFNGKTLNTGNITWYFEEEAVSHANLSMGNSREFTRNITDNVGSYNITIEYKDYDNVYPSSTNSTTLMVCSNTTIKAETVSNYVKNTTLQISLVDDNNNVFDGLVNVTLPDGSVIENIQCSQGKVFIKELNLGENNITISYPGSQYYQAAMITHTVNVVKSDAINVNLLVNDTAGNVTLEVCLYDSVDSDTIPSGEVEIINKATGEVVGRINNITSKKTNITLTLDKIGDYNLSVEYKGNNYYNPTTNTINITVVGRTSETLVTLENNTIGNTSLTVTVKDPETGNVISNAPITVTLPNGTTINTNTGATGTINIVVDIPVGNNTLKVDFIGDNTYNASTVTLNMNISQRESQTRAIITNSSLGNVTVTVTVTDKTTGTKVTSGLVEVLDKSGNIVGRGSLNNDGNALITTSIDRKDVTELTVNYMGNTNYTTSTYTIEDLTVVGRLSDINFTLNNNTHGNVSVTVSVIDPVSNTVVPNAPIKITYPDGTTETVTTDADGNYTITHELPVGENTITVEFLGTDEYNTTTKTYTFNTTMRESTTSATIQNNTIGNTTIKVVVTDKTTGQPVLYGIIEVVNVDTREVVGRARLEGTNTVNITTSITVEGTYNLRVDFKGNNNYTSSNYTLATFNVEKRASTTNITINNNVYQDTIINIRVLDPITGTPIPDAPVTITLPDNTTINRITDHEGNTIITPDLMVGENNITVTYTGNEEYNTSTTTITLNIVKRASTTTATVTNNTIRNTTINIKVTDKNNNMPVTSGEIIIKDKNTDEIVGRATLNGTNNIQIPVNINNRETYTLIVEYTGNEYYNTSTTTLDTITVTGRQASIETSINNQTSGNTSITITVKDPVTDTPIPNSTITITYPDGSIETITTDTNGNTKITPELPVGENTITINYPETSEYNTTTETLTINIEKRATTTSATIQNNTIRNTTITVTVTDKTTGQPITNGQIEITNKETGTLIATSTITNDTVTIPVNLPAGTYNLTIKYLENTNYTESQDTLDNINIEKRETSISIQTLNDTIDDTRINITIKDPVTGEVITNAPITITLPNGETINTHTGTGTITQTLNLPAGNQTITITYNGNNQYNSTTSTHTINVKKLPSKITVTRQTGYIGDNITLTATITDNNGNTITGGRVAFKLNDVTLKDTNGDVIYTTVTNGKATINYHIPSNYQAKTYKISAVYSGNNEYTTSRSNTPLLQLKQRKATLTLNSTNNIQSNTPITIHVTITDKHDPTREVNGHIILKIDGKTLKDENNITLQVPIQNNTAKHTLTLGAEYSARKHTITAILVNGTYMRSQADNTFNITTTQTNIQLNTLTMNKKGTTTLTGNIKTATGENVEGTNKIAIKIDGKTLKNNNGETKYYYTTNGNINITLTDKNYTTGTHTITVVTGERNTYTAARNNTTLTITPNTITKNKTNNHIKTSTITTQELVNIQTNKKITPLNQANQISITITDTKNKKIKTGTITWKQNNKTIQTTKNTQGTDTLQKKYNKTGTHNITITYTDPTQKYQTTNHTFQIQVIDTRTPITITSTNNKAKVGETITYTLTTRDEYKNKITEGTITTKINNKTYTNKINNGITIIPITLEKPGTYTITNTYHGTNKYKPTTNTNTITITKKTPKLTIQKITATAGTNTTITIKITTETGTPLEGQITLKHNKYNSTKTITTTTGTTTIKYHIPLNWANQKITLNATYKGNNHYNNKTITTTFTPTKQNTKITLGNTKTITIGNKITIYGKLTDQNGKNLANQKITIQTNNKTYTTQTTKYGNYNIKITPTTTGQKTITTTYNGNNYYKNSTNTSTYTTNKIKTKITVGSTKKVNKGKTMSIYGKLTDQYGKNLANQKITIQTDSKTYTTTTTKYGNYKIQITPTKTGTKTITTTYTGTNKYTKTTAKNTYQVIT